VTTDVNEVNDDIQRLNALIDGELTPAEQADVAGRLASDRHFARAHATLARLKAAVGELANETPVPVLPRARRFARTRHLLMSATSAGLHRYGPMAAGIAVILALCGAVMLGTVLTAGRPSPGETASVDPIALTLASLPQGTRIPALDSAGLRLVDVAIAPAGQANAVVAQYRGPHGCRIDLRLHPFDIPSTLSGTSLSTWRVDDIVYELAAHGMPAWRFALIADAAEQQTRHGGMPANAERRLREANAAPPPCAG
jgi:anti-sigma factor RsiW